MIKILNYYCYNNSCNPTRNYVIVRNNGNLKIQFILQYTLFGETFTRDAILLKGHRKKNNIPFFSENICLNILNISFSMSRLIHHECISGLENICYEIQGTAENPICIKTIC
ncbi:hypothetical protein G8S55_08380 [Clostridium botulinum C]|uniref:hypothetical protein n=1 Tax=Clostridium botulinum TaxID=1491 RepID=UPI001E58C38C|nr:hypothetical protein [Clostridium botulinum]MCD3217264.1 hypothetical protein [Clostridium botulinum C]